MSEFDRTIILVCDKETGEWSIVHQSNDSDAAIDEAQKIRETDKQTPLIAIRTGDFINY